VTEVAWCRIVWNHQQGDLPVVRYKDLVNIRFHTVHIDPEPGFPAGRKGLQLAGAWHQYGCKADANAAGMVTLDGDVAIDPGHVLEMSHAIAADPGAVHVAPVKIWPSGTMREDWCWSHWNTAPSQEWNVIPRYFGFNFTYLPRALLERCAKDGLASWTYPNCDSCVSQRARDGRFRCKLVPMSAPPVHLHW
jgi:hypothetical protein